MSVGVPQSYNDEMYKRINLEMQNWIIEKIEPGCDENLFIFHLINSFGDRAVKKIVKLYGNDLRAWIQ